MISGGFPLLLLGWALILNRIYLWTESTLVISFVGALCLMAIYCLIPLPNVALEYGGRVLDFFRYLKGMTFGLDVYMNSRGWYFMLCTYVLLVSIVTYWVTVSSVKVGFWMWFVSIILGLLALWIYKLFFERIQGYYRH